MCGKSGIRRSFCFWCKVGYEELGKGIIKIRVHISTFIYEYYANLVNYTEKLSTGFEMILYMPPTEPQLHRF